MNSGLLIFREVVESRNSGKSTKSHEIHKKTQNTTKFASTLIKINTRLAVNLQIYLETLSLKQDNVLKLPGVDYVAINWALIAMMLKTLPFNFAIGSILECIVVERLV